MTALADAVVAACREVDLLAGGNAHLLNDDMIGRLVEFAANGRHTFAHQVASGHAPVETRARIVSALPIDDQVRGVDQPGPLRGGVGVATQCVRCQREYVSTTSRTFLVPAGTVAVEFTVCLHCVYELNGDFGPVVWQE